ncbi:XIAP-associated factor 1 [Microcaecilia unicolor]|uniref:XIAP-associated factor 1 n=1 Tax=Microcaecilia unicolor TaxID=1415580 RepID=A0A6P7WVS4_9AMPH|nr:XIAP-associated factor 1 [Microcaecilia unicolor]
MEEVRLCNNCNRDVAISNFTLHETHCQRFLLVCTECDEPVPAAEMKEHQDTQHKQVTCKLCNQGIQQYLMETHETEECSNRLVICEFCELGLAFCKLQSHIDSCGNRTQACATCNKYVLNKDLAHHKDSCVPTALPDPGARRKSPSSRLLCPQCQQMIPEHNFLKHQNTCNPLDELLKLLPRKPNSKLGPFPPIFPVASSVTREKDNSAEQEKRRESLFDKESPFAPLEVSSESVTSNSSVEHSTSNASWSCQEDPRAYDILEICTGCNIILPSPTLKQHKKKCLDLLSMNCPV